MSGVLNLKSVWGKWRMFPKSWFFKSICLLVLLGQMTVGHTQDSQTLSMNFHDVDVDSVLHFFGEATGMSIVKDPRLVDTITITTFEETTVAEALQMLNSVLTVKGFTLVKTGQVLKVISLEDVAQSNVTVVKDYDVVDEERSVNDTVITKMIALQYAASEEVVAALQPLVGQFGSVIAYSRTNTVIITDTSANVQRLTSLIDDLDRQATSLVTKTYSIRNANMTHIANTMKQILSQYEKELGSIKINPDERTRTLFITAVPENFDRIEALIQQLDQGIPQILLEVEVIRVPYRNIDVDIRHRLFDAQEIRDEGKVINDGDAIYNWRYGLDSDPEKMFSWYGYSYNKNKAEFTRVLNGLFGPEYFEVYALPMITVADNEEASFLMGKEQYFYKLSPIDIALKMIPHLNDDNTITLEMFQGVRGESIPLQEAFARMVLRDDQTVILGGLNELARDMGPKNEAVFREDAQFVANEFLLFVTPHVILDAEAFKKKMEEDKKEAELQRQKPDLNLLFPGGFMEKSDAFKGEADRKLLPEKRTEVEAQAVASSMENGPYEESDAYRIWWKMRDVVEMPKPLVEYSENMSDHQFVEREIKEKMEVSAHGFIEELKTEQDIKYEPALSDTMMGPVVEEGTSKEGYILKETMYRRGIEFYKKGQYKGAIREFAPLMSVDPRYKSVQRYMQLAQQRYQQELTQQVDQQTITQKMAEKALENLTKVNKSMDQKMDDLSQKEPMADYVKTGTMFKYEGDPKNIPSDRIEQSKTDLISGEILDVSATHPLVVLNLGRVHKITSGMGFRVFRKEEFIGKVRVTDVGDQVSGAEFVTIKNPEIRFQYGDRVVQLVSV